MGTTTCRATRKERKQSMPGDVMAPIRVSTITHAVTMEPPPASVWPWRAQMGGGRAGWYDYDWGGDDGHPSATTILSAHQWVEPGGVISGRSRSYGRVCQITG